MNRTIPEAPNLFDARSIVYQSSDIATVNPFATSTTGTGAAVTFVEQEEPNAGHDLPR